MPKVNISVLVSGGGTNLQALIDNIENGFIDNGQIVQVISSRKDAYALSRAAKHGIKGIYIGKENYPDVEQRFRAIMDALEAERTGLVVLAGYMHILPPEMIRRYRNRIINIHPSLIPAFCGEGFYGERVHKAVLESGAAVTGATVHFVDEGVDTGPIILQKEVPVVIGDTVSSLAARVLETEHLLLPEAVRQLCRELREHGNCAMNAAADKAAGCHILKSEGRNSIMRALISVSDKTGVVEFAKALAAMGAEIISTGGTAAALSDNDIKVTGISEVTGFPECLDGRVKTLHPAVHGGILAMRSKKDHMDQLRELHIKTIEIVAINLYPFKETVRKPGTQLEDAIENIDIGGPAMLRSAAKNHRDVVVVCDPSDYDTVVSELKDTGAVSYDTKYRLALKVFEHTAAYDAMIAEYLRQQIGAGLPDNLTLTFEKVQELRYGENPHQKASYYREIMPPKGALVNAVQLHGKELSFNNINDANGALETLREFDEPAAVAVKHANPCGVGVGYDILDAYMKAYNADPISIYGGIVAVNRVIDERTAAEMAKIFIEIIIAPGFSPEALEILTKKKNIRLMTLEHIDEKAPSGAVDIKKVSGGILVQSLDDCLFNDEDIKIVTSRIPTEREMQDMAFAMRVVKHIKSNGIVIAKDRKTIGIGPGQVNRIWALENAARQATDDTRGAVIASDAFFPFDDCVTAAAAAGISAIMQPGGSVNDADSIKKADELGIAMVFTGIRHFKH